MQSANVQNHSIFTIDFEDFTEATKYEKHSKLLETLQVLHYKRARVDDPQNVCKKGSKIAPKWVQNRSKFDARTHPAACSAFFRSLNQPELIFYEFGTQNGSKSLPKWTPKSIKNRFRAQVASRKGPQTLQGPCGTSFWINFD